VAARLAELLGRPVPLVSDWVDGVDVRPGEVVLLENCRLNKGEKKNKRRAGAEDGRAVRHLRARRLRHRAPRRGLDLRHRAVRQGRLRRPAAGRRDRRHHQGAGHPKRPLVAIVAGSKVSTKLTILQSLASNVDG
jgi:phosphoglycerate kinase